jgi:hypothetical protein
MIKTKKMKMKNLILILTIAATSFGFSQEDNRSEECVKYLSLSQMYGQQKMNQDALNFFAKAYEACGIENLEKADWNNTKIFCKKLIRLEKDPIAKSNLTDTLLWVYEIGNSYENDPKWKADYATELVKLKSDRTTKIDSLYAESIHVLKSKNSTNHIKYYYTHLVRKFNDAEDKDKEIERDFAIEEYLTLSDYCDGAIKKYNTAGNEDRAEYYVKTKVFLDQYFSNLAQDCDILAKVLGEKITSLPAIKEDKITKVKGFIALLDKRDCTGSDLYGQFADTLIILEPTAEAYYAQGNFFLKRDDAKRAKEYFVKAIEMEGEGENVDKYSYSLATAHYTTGSYNAAFKTAKNIQGEYRGKAMSICANSIAATVNSCGDTSFERKANFWLANDYMKKSSSGSTKYLSNAPTQEEVFDEGLSMGSSITLKCWGESTTIR